MSVSLCMFQLELAPHSVVPREFSYIAPKYLMDQRSNASGGQEVSVKDKKDTRCKSWATSRGKRDLQDITIETYENDDNSASLVTTGARSKKSGVSDKRKGLKSNSFDSQLPSTSKEPSPALLSTQLPDAVAAVTGATSMEAVVTENAPPTDLAERKKSKELANFSSGNPFVEVIQGILHFYKENHMTPLETDVQRSELICMLAIPAWLTCHDLLHFLAPCCPGIKRVRIVRDTTPNQYMALVLFRTQAEADEFYKTFNGTRYNSMESDLCHLVYVAKVEICGQSDTEEWSLDVPLTGHTELPTCTVCLERMDESVDGILTILCNHSFHSACLAKWADTTCPVCRYLQSPEVAAESFCCECSCSESLWICLICGHVGCGRYVGGHAYNHFLETQHCYAMQLGNSRVWDYVGDNFVHRLLQNKADGKLVEVEGPTSRQPLTSKTEDMEHEDKLDSVQLEYTYLLTRQLESQRAYFEEVVDRLKEQHRQERKDSDEALREALQRSEQLQQQLVQTLREKSTLEKKQTQTASKLAKTLSQLQEEQELNRSLVSNQSSWQQRVAMLEQQVDRLQRDKDSSVSELQDQLRDIMLYLEAREKTQNSELEGGQIVLSQASAPPTSASPAKGARSRKRGK